MEFNASRLLKIEKKRNGGREGKCQVEGVRTFGRKGAALGRKPFAPMPFVVSALND